LVQKALLVLSHFYSKATILILLREYIFFKPITELNSQGNEDKSLTDNVIKICEKKITQEELLPTKLNIIDYACMVKKVIECLLEFDTEIFSKKSVLYLTGLRS
jgi:hypothetical protein